MKMETGKPIGQVEQRSSMLGRMGRWTVARILVEAGVLLVAIVAVRSIVALASLSATSTLTTGIVIGAGLLQATMLLAIYAWVVRVIERRWAVELELHHGGVHVPIGIVVGALLIGAVYLILWSLRLATFAAGHGLDWGASALTAAFLAAVMEELLLRAVLFRIVEAACGTFVALVVSAIIFGLLHSFNPGATLLSDTAIAIEAGLLLATAYALTRNIWLAVGIHTGWNFAEGWLLGAPVSGGVASHSLLHATLRGPTLLTGGAFGPEASIVSVAVCLVAATIMGSMLVRRGGWLPRTFRTKLA